MSEFREIHRAEWDSGRSILWTPGGVHDAAVPEVSLYERDDRRSWGAMIPRRDDSKHPASELLSILDTEIDALQKMAAFIREKEAEYAEPAETMGDKLRRLRAYRGYTFAELERRSGVNASVLCGIEKGRLSGWGKGVAKFKSLAMAFGMTMDEFADGLQMPVGGDKRQSETSARPSSPT